MHGRDRGELTLMSHAERRLLAQRSVVEVEVLAHVRGTAVASGARVQRVPEGMLTAGRRPPPAFAARPAIPVSLDIADAGTGEPAPAGDLAWRQCQRCPVMVPSRLPATKPTIGPGDEGGTEAGVMVCRWTVR